MRARFLKVLIAYKNNFLMVYYKWLMNRLLITFFSALTNIKKAFSKLVLNLIWFLPPPNWDGPIYYYRKRMDIRDPRNRFTFRTIDYISDRLNNRRVNPEFVFHRLERYNSFDAEALVDKFVYGSENQIIEFIKPHYWVVVFLCFWAFWFIIAFFAGYRDVWMGFMAIAMFAALGILFWSIKVHFLVSYFLAGLLLFVVWLFVVPQLIYCYEWLTFITLLTIGALLWATASDFRPWTLWGLVPILWFVPLIIVPMSYVYTIMMNDVLVPTFEPETETWEESETQGGQSPEVKLVRLVLKEQSRIRRLRVYFKNLITMKEAAEEEYTTEELDQDKGQHVIYVGVADDPDNPLPAIDETKVKWDTVKAAIAEGVEQHKVDMGWQASIGEQKRVKFINKRIADFEKDMLEAPNEAARLEYVNKINTLKRKKIDDNIDAMRHEKADQEQRMIRGLHEPTYQDLLLHAQDATTLELRIQNRERSLEIAAEDPLFLSEGSSPGNALRLPYNVRDMRLFDDDEVAAAQQSEKYKLVQNTLNEIRYNLANPKKDFTGTAKEFSMTDDDSLNEEVQPEAKLLAYSKGWDMFSPREKDAMKKEDLWPPETIRWNPVKKKFEKLKPKK